MLLFKGIATLLMFYLLSLYVVTWEKAKNQANKNLIIFSVVTLVMGIVAIWG